MRYIMIRCVMFVTLFAGFNNLCMESNEENNKEQSQLDNELKRVRQEKAAQYQREKEKKQKEAEQQKTKTRKKKKQEELPKAEPGRGKEEVDMTFEQRRAESKKIVKRLLDATRGKEVEEKPLSFAEAHKAIEEERNRLQQKNLNLQKKLAQQQEQQSDVQEFTDISARKCLDFFQQNLKQLYEVNFDPKVIELIIRWINNHPNAWKFILEKHRAEFTQYLRINSRILYTLWHSVHFPYNEFRDEDYDLSGLSMSSRARNILSAQMLFTPFALSRGVLKSFEKMYNLSGFLKPGWGDNWIKILFTFGLDRETVDMELNRLKAALAEDKNGDIEYLSITRNVDLIRVILFFATYTAHDTEVNAQDPVTYKQPSDITGNEKTPDGTTALMFAVGGGYIGIVKELLRRGANPFLMNNHGDDAFSIVEIQMERAKLHDDKFIKIYTRIQQLLEASARKYALHIAQLIRALQSERQVTLPNGTAIVVPGLPYDLVLPIALANLSTNEQRAISILLDQFPADRLLPAELTHAAPPVAQGLLSNPSAWIAALLSYYFSSANKS